MKDKADIDELRWVRVFSSVHIPKYLVEQVKHRDYSVEDFYKYQEINCLINGKDGPTLNPFNHLYVLADEDNIVQGFLWFVIDALTKDGVINTFSVNNKYWCKGQAVKRLANHVKEMTKKLKLKKVYWVTNYPRHSERHGFRQSKSVLMEYTEVKDGKDNDGGKHSRGQCEHVDTRTTKSVQQLSNVPGADGTADVRKFSTANGPGANG